MDSEALIKRLEKEIGKYPDAAVAFSGGVDSSVVAAIAKRACKKALAITADSPLLAKGELENAKKVAKEIGIEHLVLYEDELANAELVRNDPDRCYFCKKALFSKIRANIGKSAVVFDGSNASEKSEHRPGMRAAKELGVVSPLIDAGISKKEIREMAKELKLSNWDKPSMACLASRVPYGTSISKGKVAKIDAAENALRALGFSAVRVRDYEGLARIEIAPDAFALAIEKRGVIISSLKALGYSYVTIDLEGYNPGSMNRTLKAERTQISGL